MSNKPRCKTCNHKRGPRALGRIVTSEDKGAHTGDYKKKYCSCGCHSVEKFSYDKRNPV